jgi:hypothetical protein
LGNCEIVFLLNGISLRRGFIGCRRTFGTCIENARGVLDEAPRAAACHMVILGRIVMGTLVGMWISRLKVCKI